MTEEQENATIHRETAAVRELVAAKFDGVYAVLDKMGDALDRVTRTVEKQGEQQVQLAVLTSSVAHMSTAFSENRDKLSDEIVGISDRLSKIEQAAAFWTWRFSTAKVASIAALSGIAAFVTSNFDAVIKFFGG